MTQKTCFVVSPIGDRGTDVRRQADCVLEYIIKPALAGLDYDEPIRVDRLDKPTHITTEIVQHLISAELVIADLSGSNANVFYELGIRHAFQKPCIMLSNWDPRPPFDVSGSNIIQYVHDDPSSHSEAVTRIRNQIEKFGDGNPVSNPVTVANGFTKLETSGDDKDQIVATLVKKVDDLSGRLLAFERNRELVSDLLTTRNALADFSPENSANRNALRARIYSDDVTGVKRAAWTIRGVDKDSDQQD
ncbi:hypothetical protein FGK63_14270 [Ruegeria sediminis]|uniref:Nucleoside 2-deoxyribosyltransferase n=1 Tax=Ruegeria sediminis TaxID=2583820 RepID=A0ABY2WVD3_9RHOB|nr:hypothetical protein [Ruegeria sediminis]TMV06320.1 hypothetical protein FGK63_14270 [Ruegeria sediminis]